MVDDIVQEGKVLLAHAKAKLLVSEAEILSEQDLRGALGMLREALLIAPDYPDLEDEIYLREDAIEKLDGVLQHIMTQLEEGKTYRAYQLLQELPDNYIIYEKSGTVDQLQEKVDKVEDMIAAARNLPRSGNSPSLLMLEEAYELMPDYPGLIEDIEALKKSQHNYNDYISGVEVAVAESDTEKARLLLEKFKSVYTEDASVGRLEVVIHNKEKEISKKNAMKMNLIKAACAAAVLLVLIVVYFSFEIMSYGSAEKKWGELQVHLKAEEYEKVKDVGEALRNKLAHVRLTSQSKKKGLLNRVEEILASENVVQGAQGKILVDGSYIPKESLSGAQEAKKIIKEAEDLKNSGKYNASVSRFEDARKVAGLLDSKVAETINKSIDSSIRKVRIAHVKSILAKASSHYKDGSYDEALGDYGNARNIAQGYGFKRNSSISREIENGTDKTRKTKLDSLIADGDGLLRSSEYENSIIVYKKALDFARLQKIDSNETVNKLYGSINRARISGLLAKGDENFTASRWLDSIRYYNNAVDLSVKAGLRNLPILDQALVNVKLAETKISLDELKRLELAAGKLFADEKWQEAHELYNNLVSIAGSGGYSDKADFLAILNSAREKLAVTEDRIFINSRKEYLLEKYRVILKKAFGSSNDIAFLNPEVILLTSDEKMLQFSLTAKSYVKKGSSEGRYSSYEVQYAYNKDKESWHLISKTSSSQ